MAEILPFIEDILREAEERREQEKVQMDKLRADTMLQAVAVLDRNMAGVNTLCDAEIARIEVYRQAELSRLDKKRSWLVFNLDCYLRETGEKTIRLPNGTIKLRKGRDRVAIVSMELFLQKAAQHGLLKQVPEQFTPNPHAIMEYLKRTKSVPDGCEFIPGETRFSYTTTTEANDGTDANQAERTTEAGTAA